MVMFIHFVGLVNNTSHSKAAYCFVRFASFWVYFLEFFKKRNCTRRSGSCNFSFLKNSHCNNVFYNYYVTKL